MVHDLEYFTEFLENPSAPDLNEFFRILRQWGKYIEAHKDEFCYLEDDEWKEIRERLIAELEIRVPQQDDLADVYDEMNEACEKLDQYNHEEAIALLNRKLIFMKSYQYVFDIKDERIAEFEEQIVDYAETCVAARKADEKVHRLKKELEKAYADLDEELAECYERTGKIPVLPMYPDKKNHKGN